MNCSSCGASLPSGAAACPVCGTPVTYPPDGSLYNGPVYGGSSPYDPTALSPRYGTPPPLSTGYGSPTYGTPPLSTNPYASPPYEGVSSSPPYPYTAPPLQQSGYGMQPPPLQPYVQPPPPGRRSKVGLIIGVVLLVLVLACVGTSAVVYLGVQHGINTVVSSADATATAIEGTVTTSTGITPPSGQITAPSGLSIDPVAAAIITNARMSNGVDSKYYPITLTNTFTTNQTPDVVFNLTLPQDGYTVAKWYFNGTFLFKNAVLTLAANYDHGYFPSPSLYHNPGKGAVELYWCTQSNCSDAKLAAVTNFTITS